MHNYIEDNASDPDGAVPDHERTCHGLSSSSEDGLPSNRMVAAQKSASPVHSNSEARNRSPHGPTEGNPDDRVARSPSIAISSSPSPVIPVGDDAAGPAPQAEPAEPSSVSRMPEEAMNSCDTNLASSIDHSTPTHISHHTNITHTTSFEPTFSKPVRPMSSNPVATGREASTENALGSKSSTAIAPLTSPLGTSDSTAFTPRQPSVSTSASSFKMKGSEGGDVESSLSGSKRKDTDEDQDASTPPGSTASRRDSLPMGLRNKKMRPTDCLLFAATLLEEEKSDKNSERNESDAKEKELSGAKASADTSHTQVSTQDAANPSTLIQGNAAGTSIAQTLDAMKKDAGNALSTLASTAAASSAATTQPRDMDVLCGRGGLINKHKGNIAYRRVVDHNKPFYHSVHKRHRMLVSQSIVEAILKNGGRFLVMEESQAKGAKKREAQPSSNTTAGKPNGTSAGAPTATALTWLPIDFKRAVQKTSQALRERGPSNGKKGDSSKSFDSEDIPEQAVPETTGMGKKESMGTISH